MTEPKLATLAVHAGSPDGANAPLTVPIVQSTTYRFASAAEVQRYEKGGSGLAMYSRYENPTVSAAEEAIAKLEGAEDCVLFASGMGAMTTALLQLLSAGDPVIAASALYGGTYKFIRDVLPRFGISMRAFEPEEMVEACEAGAKLCVFESLTNPTLRVTDVAAVAKACRSSDTISLVDSTFATPMLLRPLKHGVDLVMHSTTKYLNGHSDHLGGAICGSRERVEPIRNFGRKLGASMDPQVAYDLLRGLKTLAVRVERQCASALKIARWLEAQKQVTRVCYPGLESHPDHQLAKQQLGSFGGMVTFSVGTKEKAFAFWDRQKVIARAASLGGVESLSSLPILFSHTGYTPEELRKAGVDEGMVRLSVGLEDTDDLIEDLRQALV